MQWPWKKKIDPIKAFEHVTIPVVRNQGNAIRTDDMFDGPSLSTPVDGVFKWRYVRRGRLERLWDKVRFQWKKMRGQVRDDCWW
jgi:hypothetical protein